MTITANLPPECHIIHFHHSDARSCSRRHPFRQFAFEAAEITCPDCNPVGDVFALLSAQGTACEETALYRDEYTVENRRRIEARFCSEAAHGDPPIPGTWTNVSANEAFLSPPPQ